MGLTATIQAAVAAAFDAVGDLKIAATIVRTVAGTYDPTLGKPVFTELSYEGEVILTATNEAHSEEQAATGNRAERVLTTTRAGLFRIEGITPRPGDRFVVNGEEYRLSTVKPLQTGDTVFIYEVEVEG